MLAHWEEDMAEGKAQSLLHDGRFRVGFSLRKIHQKNQAIWQELCPDPSLTPVQAGALSVLYYQGPCSLSELGAAAAIDLSTVRGVVDRLRKRRLVSTKTDKRDGRKVIVRLEPAGEELIVQMMPIMRRIADETLKPLNPAERLAFEFLVQKLIGDDEA
jgi:DNA-binding MarR family transcriptional regulator